MAKRLDATFPFTHGILKAGNYLLFPSDERVKFERPEHGQLKIFHGVVVTVDTNILD